MFIGDMFTRFPQPFHPSTKTFIFSTAFGGGMARVNDRQTLENMRALQVEFFI